MWALKNKCHTALVFGEHGEDVIRYVNGKFLEQNDELNISLKRIINKSVASILENAYMPTYASGNSINRIINSLISGKRTQHCLSVYDKTRGVCMTMPVFLDKGNVEIQKFNFPLHVLKRLSEMENKIKKMLDNSKKLKEMDDKTILKTSIAYKQLVS